MSEAVDPATVVFGIERKAPVLDPAVNREQPVRRVLDLDVVREQPRREDDAAVRDADLHVVECIVARFRPLSARALDTLLEPGFETTSDMVWKCFKTVSAEILSADF
jgi:hypothetical protein